jgi:hypothetical protein
MIDADKPRFVEAVGRLAVALREKDPDVVTLRVYFDGLRTLEIELVDAAAERLMSAAWFPKVSEWRAAAAKIEGERRAAQRELLRKLPTPICDRCADTGWIELGAGETFKGHTATRRAEPCACQQARRLELLGRRHWPALPAGAPATEDRAFTRAESARAVTEFERARGARLVKTMPEDPPRRARSATQRAFEIVLQGIAAQVKRVAAAEAVVATKTGTDGDPR